MALSVEVISFFGLVDFFFFFFFFFRLAAGGLQWGVS
jgi:hypothetical protein